MFDALLPPLQASPEDIPPETEHRDPDADEQAISYMREADSGYKPAPAQPAVRHRRMKMGWMAYTDELGPLGVFEDHGDAADFSSDFEATITPVPLYLRKKRSHKLRKAMWHVLEKLGRQTQPVNLRALPASDPRHVHDWVV